jgi:Glycosyl hydrolases family 39
MGGTVHKVKGKITFMEKSKFKSFRFLLGGKKRNKTTRILGLLAVILVLSLTVLLIARTQLGTTAASTNGVTGDFGTQQNSAFSVASQDQQGDFSSSAADIKVDFGSRNNQAHPIPYQFLGIGGIDMNIALNNNGGKYVPQAGFHLTKLGDFDYISEIFSSSDSMTNASHQNWSHLDSQMSLAMNYNLQPMITLAYTPNWLQPQNQSPKQTNPCLTYSPPISPANVKPMYLVNGNDNGTQMWGKLAAQIVAHIDRNFPHAHAIYEIWNQPDSGQFLCMPKGDNNADADRVKAYKAIYAAAAPLMRHQANQDGVQIKIGGPALVYAMQNHLTMWFPSLLNDPSIYPYVDFVSYHRYLYGANFNGGRGNSLVGNTQDSLLGVAAEYEQVAKAVRAGKQPNAAHTPIYIDEYNMNPCVPNVCRNDPTLSPLDQGLFVVDLLNTVNDTQSKYGAAGAVPAGLAYYTWFTPQGNLCMFGVINAKMDCGPQGSPLQPYPQYYAYNVLGGANYLDMTNGAYMAKAASAKPSGVYVTGFYSKNKDSFVLVNTTGTDHPTLNVLAQNPGKASGTTANVYKIKVDLSHPVDSIINQQVKLIAGSNGYGMVVHLPPYTMIGISFAA